MDFRPGLWPTASQVLQLYNELSLETKSANGIASFRDKVKMELLRNDDKFHLISPFVNLMF